jgi:hypothetical protein
MSALSTFAVSPADAYLRQRLTAHAVDTGFNSPVRLVQATLAPILWTWGNGNLRAVHPSGSFAKGTGNNIGTDIDLFISVAHNVQETHAEIRDKLFQALINAGYAPRHQNVSVGLKVLGYDVDLVPGKHHPASVEDHGLFIRRKNTWTKTNVQTHINLVRSWGCTEEIRVLKLWRHRNRLDFPSFYLELTTMVALNGRQQGDLAANVWHVLKYLSTDFLQATVFDPANGQNEISADITNAEKRAISTAAASSLTKGTWGEII